MSEMLIDSVLKASAMSADSEGVDIADKLFCVLDSLREVQVQVRSVFVEVGRAFAREQCQDSPFMIRFEAFLTWFMPSDQCFEAEPVQDLVGYLLAEQLTCATRGRTCSACIFIWVAPEHVFQQGLFWMFQVGEGQIIQGSGLFWQAPVNH